MTRPFPPAFPHGDLREVLPGLFLVTGSAKLPVPMPVWFSRNMTVIREGARVVLVNSVRLNDAGLAALDALGKVTDVIRLAGFHGMDDPFYKDRYGARVWALKQAPYRAGLSGKGPDYLVPDVAMDDATVLPVEGARLYRFNTAPDEALLVLERHGGVVVAGDALQNWAAPDAYFNGVARVMMRMMGFLKPHNLGPGWLRSTKPAPAAVHGVLALPFEHVLPSHGTEVLGGAREKYRPVIEAYRG